MQTGIASNPPSLVRAVSSEGWLGRRLPAFPAVRSGLEGFCLPTLPFIGIPIHKMAAHKSQKCVLVEMDPITDS